MPITPPTGSDLHAETQEFGVQGYFFRYERHFVYWRRLGNGDIGIVTILHERMHQIDRFREDFGL
jgi:plasmid stabilization system protein ParE